MSGSGALASPDTLLLSELGEGEPIDKYSRYAVAPKSFALDQVSFSSEPVLSASGDSALFIQLFVKNNGESNTRIFLQLPLIEYWQMRTRSPGGNWQRGYTGYLEDYSRLDVAGEKQYFDVEIEAGTVKEIQLKAFNKSTRSISVRPVSILSETGFYRLRYEQLDQNIWGLGISIFFQGAIWLMMLYMFLLYFQNNRDKTYLFYGLYMFFAMYYLLQKIAGDGPFYFLFPDNATLRHLLNEPVQWLIYIFYNLFVLRFLEVKKHSPRLYNFLKVLSIAYAVYLVAELIFMVITFDKVTEAYLYLITRLLVIAVSVYIIIQVIRLVKSPLVAYIITGSILFMLFTIASMLYSLRLEWLPGTDLYPINFMQIGIMLEILCFSLGLGRKMRLESIEKTKLQRAYIDQLVRNEEMIQRTNKQLTEEVHQRTAEIMLKTRELEREREKKLKAEYEKQLSESEMNSLRLQMNPHFIFNSLNSIRYYILKEDPEKASDYITSFSKLLRMILQHSKQNSVKLSEELEALKLYLEFERQRFESKFEFTLKLGEEVEPEELNIQPMIIQPFVENSIWHGLMPRQDKGHLLLEIHLHKNKILQVIIEDDGIGREEARKLEEQQERKTYKSMGLQITRDRLQLMKKLNHGESGYEIEDLVDEQGRAIGTRVILKIKLK